MPLQPGLGPDPLADGIRDIGSEPDEIAGDEDRAVTGAVGEGERLDVEIGGHAFVGMSPRGVSREVDRLRRGDADGGRGRGPARSLGAQAVAGQQDEDQAEDGGERAAPPPGGARRTEALSRDVDPSIQISDLLHPADQLPPGHPDPDSLAHGHGAHLPDHTAILLEDQAIAAVQHTKG